MWSRSKYPRIPQPTIEHSWPCTTNAVSISTGMWRPRCRDRRDVLALLDDRGDERFTQLFAHPQRVDRPDTWNLAPRPGQRFAALQYFVIDHHMHSRLDTARFGLAENQGRERVGRIRLERLVFSSCPAGAEDPLHLVLEGLLHGTADFGSHAPASREHAVGVGPGSYDTSLALPLRAGCRVLNLGTGADARVSERDQPLIRRVEQLLFGAGVVHCDLGDHRRLLHRQRAARHRGCGRRQLLQLPRRLDHNTCLARTHTQPPRHERGRAPFALDARAARSRESQRGFRDHPVDDATDLTELFQRTRRVARVQRFGIELPGRRLYGRHQRAKHTFVSYGRGVTVTPRTRTRRC